MKKVLLDDYVNNEKNLLDLEYDFIEKLSKIRKEKGISQRELCKMINMKQPYLVKIEKREISPSLNTILKIMNALNLSLNVVEKESHK